MSEASAIPSAGSRLSKGAATAAAVTASVFMLAMAITAAPASALYGDDYGAAPINGHPDAVQDVAAYPGNYGVWAGACDRGSAPAPGSGTDLAALGAGGLGQLPATVLTGTASFNNVLSFDAEQVAVPAPATPDQCIDPGAPSVYGYQESVWQRIPYTSTIQSGFGQATPVGDYAPSWRLPAATAAGSHPDGTTTLFWARNTDGVGVPVGKPDGSVDNVVVDLPAGFVGDPTAVPPCTGEQFAAKPPACPPQTQVGIIRLSLESVCFAGPPCNIGNALELIHPVYNVEPREGYVAELGFGWAGTETTVRIGAKARTNGDFGVTAFAGQIPAALVPLSQQITVWGVPWAAANDAWRAPAGLVPQATGPTQCNFQPGTLAGITTNLIPVSGLKDDAAPLDCQQHYEPSWGPIRPFFTGQTECAGTNVTTVIRTDAYQHPGAFTAEGDPDPNDADWKTYPVESPPVTHCAKLPFEPSADVSPTSTAADAPSGLNVDITVPQNDDPPASVATDPGSAADPTDGAPGHWRSEAGLATAHLDKTVVPLPEGFTINPSAAAGLEGCSDTQMGVTVTGNPYRFNNTEPSCPDGSRIGTVEATTPLLEEKLTGEFILGTPRSTNPASGEMLRVFLVLRNKERGLLAKVHGTSVADPVTGRLTATFDKNPRVPVENITVSLKGGDRGLFAQAPTCGEKTTSSVFTPWTAAHGGGGVAKTIGDTFTVAGDCSFGFKPTLTAGMSTSKARGTGTFSFRFERPQGQQWVDGLVAQLPTGLLASVKDVPLCTDAQAAAGKCPAASRIGMVDASAGSGTPFVLEQKGSAFLTEGYKGCAYGLAVTVPVIAGPFRGDMQLSDINVRQSVCLDPTTAQVTVTSDSLPTIHHGVPLRVRSVTVNVDRDRFMLNPSDCSAKQVGADILSAEGATANVSNAFQTAGCADLAFKPRLNLRLTGRKQTRTGKHPGIKAKVTQTGIGEAGIERAVVRLPKSLALDPDNAQALCEFADGTKDDLEGHCPKGSIVGRARAVSPLLNRALAGNVYFVKNIRTDPKSGNQIRTLPMIIVALRGEIAINLKGESDTTKDGKLVNTFASVPDAPVSQFNLNIKGGSKGILAVTRTRKAKINLCAGRHVAEADMDGHNGKRHDRDVAVAKPCSKRQTRAAKQRAKRRAADAGRRVGGPARGARGTAKQVSNRS